MRARLCEDITLRSWKLVPHAYYRYKVREAQGVTGEEFQLLLRCDGEHDLEDTPLLRSLIARGLAEECRPGEGLAPWQRHRVCGNRYFPHLNWAITGKCNFNCLHCFMAADNAPMMEEFTWEEMLSLLDQCEECGVQTLTLTGGEPLLHPRFLDLLKECARRRLWVTKLYTNGAFVTEELLDQIRDLGLDPLISISHDGIGHHDWMRNHPHAEEIANRAIALCVKKGFHTRVQTCVHRGNLDTLYETVAAMDALGVEEVRVIRTSETPRWQENGGDLCLSVTEYYDAMVELLGKNLKNNLSIRLNLWHVAVCDPRQGYYGYAPVQANCKTYRDSIPVCRGARGTIAVAHTGELSPCNQLAGTFAKMGIRLGNVKRKPLRELLSAGEYLDTVTLPVKAVRERNQACQTCQYWTACMGGCRAIATAFTKDYFHRDFSKCAFFKGGYLQKIDDAVAANAPGLVCANDTEGMGKGGEPGFVPEMPALG